MTTRETIVALARSISNTPLDATTTPDLFGASQIERFYLAAFAAGMEEAAKVCDDLWQNDASAYDCREAIREKAAEVMK